MQYLCCKERLVLEQVAELSRPHTWADDLLYRCMTRSGSLTTLTILSKLHVNSLDKSISTDQIADRSEKIY